MRRFADLIHKRETDAFVAPEHFNAADLLDMLRNDAFDRDDASIYLGISKMAVQMAAYRHTLPYVQYKSLRLFARSDLDEYAKKRGVGRHSRLKKKAHYEIVARQAIRVEPPL